MTKDEALKLALETLEYAGPSWIDARQPAITAIKEALAQPEQDWIERERAVGYREGHQNALKQMAQPEQEPVAIADGTFNHNCPIGTPLYTTPPQRKPLTDEEVHDAVRESDLDWHQGWTLDDDEPNRFMSLARAIEAAHDIKE